MTRIPGPAIVGLADVFVGATPAKKPVIVVKTNPGAQTLTRRGAGTQGAPPPGGKAAPPPSGKGSIRANKGGTNKDGFGHAKAAAANAFMAGKRADNAAKGAAASVKQHKAAVKLGYHSPIIPLDILGVREDGQVVLGAVTKKPLTPAQQAAVQKHNSAIAKTAAATRRLGALAKKAQQAGQAAHGAYQQTTNAIAHALKPKWPRGKPAMVGAEDLAYLEHYYDVVGAGPDPDRPGFLTDGSLDPIILLGDDPMPMDPNAMDPNAAPAGPDPSQLPPDAGPDPAAGDLSAQDLGTGAVTAPDGTVLYDPATDPEVVPIPQRDGTLSQEEAFSPWQHVSDDAIVYDGAGGGWTETSVASWNFFYGPKTGDGQYGDGYYQGPNNQWWFRLNGEAHPKGNTLDVDADSVTHGWGALIGKPGSQLAGLQYATVDKKWFWQGKNAPSWAARETDARIADANKKIKEANRAAALVQAAQMQKDLFEQAQAKAKQDAANALAMSAADTQSQISQKQVEAQKSQLEVQQQKAELSAQQAEAQMAVSQQQADLQAAQQQAQLDAQAQHALVTQADVWNQWAKAHPEEAVQQMQQGMAPGGDHYGGGESYEDGYEDPYGAQNDGPRMYGGEDDSGDGGGDESLEDD